MGFLFNTLEAYDEEITFVRTQMRNAVKAKDFKLNTSQSSQAVSMDVKEIRIYLQSLTTEREAFIERSAGAGVTSLTFRRFG